jgi:hypothetical protein
MSKLPKIKMLADLHEPKYHNLAIDAAKNLGGWKIHDFDSAYAWLTTCAMETSEDGVIAEVNFCR